MKRIIGAFIVALMLLTQVPVTALSQEAIKVIAADEGSGGGIDAPFELEGVNISNGQKNVPLDEMIMFTFSKAVAGSVHDFTESGIPSGTEMVDYNAKFFSIVDDKGNNIEIEILGARGNTSASGIKRNLFLEAVGGFKPNTTYTLTVDKGVRPRNGINETKKVYVYTFTTIALNEEEGNGSNGGTDGGSNGGTDNGSNGGTDNGSNEGTDNGSNQDNDVRDLTITGGKLDSDYIYKDNILTIKTNTHIVISGVTNKNRIIVESDNSNITFEDINIDASKYPNVGAVEILGNKAANIYFKGNNSLISGSNKAGIEVNKSGKLNIKGEDKNNNAILSVTGGDFASGIGLGPKGLNGTINVPGGKVIATPGKELEKLDASKKFSSLLSFDNSELNLTSFNSNNINSVDNIKLNTLTSNQTPGSGGGLDAPFNLNSATISDNETDVPLDKKLTFSFTKAVAGKVHDFMESGIKDGTEMVDYNSKFFSMVDENNKNVNIKVTGARGETSAKDSKRDLHVEVVGGLKEGKKYTLTIKKGVTARNGINKTDEQYVYTFATSSKTNNKDKTEAQVVDDKTKNDKEKPTTKQDVNTKTNPKPSDKNNKTATEESVSGTGDVPGGGGGPEAPLLIESATIKDEQKDIKTDHVFKFVFSKNVAAENVIGHNAKCFKLIDSNGNEVPIEVYGDSYDWDKRRELFMKVKDGLKPGEKYTLLISKNIIARNQINTLEQNYKYIFYTEGYEDGNKEDKYDEEAINNEFKDQKIDTVDKNEAPKKSVNTSKVIIVVIASSVGVIAVLFILNKKYKFVEKLLIKLKK